ncbi:MAG: hypothetical protein K0S33_756 [Bacteroidetes bacterium]|jgi:hypothetical protein|nr:hypothetical protein [Bacteroidota bacterium]
MKSALIIFVSLLGMFTTYATGASDRKDPLIGKSYSVTGEKAWKTEYEDSKVLIESCHIVYTSQGNTTNHERVIFRYTNRTTGNLKISFGRKMVYNGVCYGCDKTDKKFTLELSAHQSKEFSEENKDKTYYIFSKDLKSTITKTLDSFELTNIETIVQ